MDSAAFEVPDADYTCVPGQVWVELSNDTALAHRVAIPDVRTSAAGRVPKAGERWRFKVEGTPGAFPGAVDEIVEIVDACHGFTCFASPLYGIVVVDPVGRPGAGVITPLTAAGTSKPDGEISLAEWRREIEIMGSPLPWRA